MGSCLGCLHGVGMGCLGVSLVIGTLRGGGGRGVGDYTSLNRLH